MSTTLSTGGRLGVYHDTGSPEGSSDFTTLVILHGHNWHGGTFSRLIPLAHRNNIRLVLLNRRDYPGSTPYTDEERAMVAKLTPNADEEALAQAREKFSIFLKDRAREVYDFLEDLVKRDNIPPSQRDLNTGGIVVAGWSLGALWTTSLLAYAPQFPVNDVDLSQYVRRVIVLDTGNIVMGYPRRSDMYTRAFDPRLSLEERAASYDMWDRALAISGYYPHGDTLDTIALKPLEHPFPTLSTLSAEERAKMTFKTDGNLDSRITLTGIQTGHFANVRERALLVPGDEDVVGDSWCNVEARFVWGGKSLPEVSHAMLTLRTEVEAAKEKGLLLRNVKLVIVKEGNHFVHWDHPEEAMRALLGEHEII
ncbi:Alpha/Beta hydrolase protein [Dichomitus squalens]|uniref:Alpha/Beta hydrolase protein n=1 Tax=Dichomitus squalens TaxID=114155 RepID=A0A4Q9MFL0_9APHY|nr:Alpha/Beta hydrolase protein [Dichomitus squalens]